jgi:hypothetical protein
MSISSARGTGTIFRFVIPDDDSLAPQLTSAA